MAGMGGLVNKLGRFVKRRLKTLALWGAFGVKVLPLGVFTQLACVV